MMARLSILFLLCSSSVLAASPYVGVGGGFLRGSTTTLHDRDCSSTQPPALFGCGYFARGAFGDSPLYRVAGGVSSSRARVELELASRPSLDLNANANFTGVAFPQPVRARVSSRSAFVIGALDLGSARVRPFIAAGAGVARNETSSVRFTFPSIAPNATTTIRGGERTSFAWTTSAGASVALTPSLHLDLALRYDDLGDIYTDAGAATIVRPTRTLTIDIAGTRGRIRAGGALATLRWNW
jgi:opacity protein-like surface antigen